MNVSRVYNINSSNQLIDLNGDSVNFDVYYKLQTENNTPFYITVASQTMIDSNSNLSLTRVDSGEFVGRKRVVENEFQNYYLIVRADTECKCTIELIKNALPINRSASLLAGSNQLASPSATSSSGRYAFYYVGILVLLAGLGYYYSPQIKKAFTGDVPSAGPSLDMSKLPPVRAPSALPRAKPVLPTSNLVSKIKSLDL
jgi:hypothetical protein